MASVSTTHAFPEGLLADLLAVSITGICLLRPLYGAGGKLEDFVVDYLNPAAQRLTGLAERPGGPASSRTISLFTDGALEFYRHVFETGEAGRYDANPQVEGPAPNFHVAARRSGDLLAVSFTDASDQDRSAVAEALRDSRAREQAARAEAEAQRRRFYEVLQQLPAQVATYVGPDHIFTFVNERFSSFVATQGLLNRPVREAAQGAVTPEVFALLDQVYTTGEPVQMREVEVRLPHWQPDPAQPLFINASYYPLHDAQGQVCGVLDFSYDVTAQVLARRQVEQLNRELETRVAERTQQLATALHEAEHQQAQLAGQQGLLREILGQVPAAVATLSGPEHRYSFFNDPYQALSAGRTALGRTVAEVFPEVAEQGFLALLDQVYATGQPFSGTETVAMLHDQATGRAEPRYVDFTHQPLLDEAGQPQGILAFILDVTDRVRARKQADTLQQALFNVTQRRAQERQDLLAVFAHAPMGVALLREPDHRLDYWNESFNNFFPGARMGATVEEALPDLATEEVLAQLDRLYQNGETYQGPVTRLPGPGTPRYVTFTYQAYREQGHVAGVALFVQDVTAQELARRQLEEANQQLDQRARARLNAIFAQAPVGIALYEGPDHVVALANPDICAQYGYPAAHVLNQPLFERVPELRGQGFEQQLADVLRTGQPYVATEAPVAVRRAAGVVTRYFDFVYQVLRDADQQVLGVLNMAQDVTERVLARQQLEQVSQQLAAAQALAERERALLQAMLTQAPVAIALFQGPDVRIASANERMAALWGRTPQQVVGRPLLEALPELAGQGFDEMIQAVQTTQIPYLGTEAPARILKAGKMVVRYYNYSCQPIYDAQGALLGVINIGTEVTEQVEARQELEQLNQELEARVWERTERVQLLNEELQVRNAQLTRVNTDLDSFVYTASHDLKAPITNLEGLLLALREELPAPALAEPTAAHILELMTGSLARFQNTLRHLTTFTRPLAEAATEVQEIELAPLVEAVRLDLDEALTAAQAELQVAVAACERVRFSPKILRSIVFNLLSNALKYRHPDRAPRIAVRASCQQQELELAVQDNGLGLSEPQQQRLFGLFQRLHTHVEGSGVGLYSIKRLIDNAGGTITVVSAAGVGSTFTVRLPLA